MDIIYENCSFFMCCKFVVGLLWHSSIWNFLMKNKDKNQAHEELGMYKLGGIIWYFIQIGCCWKFDPTCPLDDLSLISPYPYTLHTASKLYSFVILITSQSQVIYIHERSFVAFWNFDSTWSLRDSYWEGAKSYKMLSKYFLTYNAF